MRRNIEWALGIALAVCGCSEQVASDPCALAASHMSECFGVEASAITTCDAEQALRISESTCDELAEVTGKADNPFSDFFCDVVGWDCPVASPLNEISSVRFPGDGTFWLRVSHTPSTPGARLSLQVDDYYHRDVEGTVVVSDPVREAPPFDAIYVIRFVETSSIGERISGGVCLEAEAVIVFDRLSSLTRRDCTG